MEKAMNSKLLGVRRPICLGSGEFAPVQCKGSVCYCADSNGTSIGYEKPINLSDKMNCS